ncbi:MAG: acyl-CoA dehydrogenase family protein [Myxococcota bacterium]|nr:acyl-CoA dehydrogenase family protein [Myxococcota bacterium]
MDFELTETQRLVEETARRFASERLAPRAAEMERQEQIDPALLRELGELGLMAVNVPESLGGAGAGAVAYALAMMEIARGCASTAVTMAVVNMVAEVLVRFGDEAQRARYVPRLARGEMLGAFALSEPDAGSDPASLRTVARRDGDGWRLDGSKQWISHGDTAGLLVVWARTGEAGSRGLSCFLVEGGAPGLVVSRLEDKMGLRASHTAALQLDGVRVPGEAMLGAPGDGFRIAMTALDGGRIGIGAQAIGIAQAAFEAMTRYARERVQFGVPIAEHQAVQWMIADSRVDRDAARLLVLRAAWLKERGVPFTREASMAKLVATEAAWRIVNRAVQVHGGYGYIREYPVERHLRDARVTQIYEGTSEIQRLVIARSLLRG